MAGLREEFTKAWWLRPLFREPLRFVARAVAGRPGAHAYRLRPVDATVLVRHDQSDAFVIHEVFRSGFYTPPDPVRAILPAADEPIDVLDLGGNIGLFGLRIRSLYPRARIVAFEPEPDNARLLRRTIELNGAEDWEVVQACAAPAEGTLEFLDGSAGLSRIPDPGERGTITVPALDVFGYFDGVDLLKMDIEGGEWAILGDPRFPAAAPRAILLEWHSYHCPQDNPRRAAAQRLRELGYAVAHEHEPPEGDPDPYYGAGTLWAWREEPE
jgi:FkbM family methyltransferase